MLSQLSRRRARWSASIAIVLSFFVVACNNTSSGAKLQPSLTATSQPLTATPISTTATATLPPARYTTLTIAHGFGMPDDLALDRQGQVIFSDFGNNSVNRIATDGTVTPLASGFPEPEGLIPMPDGSLIVAVQGKDGEHIDRIEHVTPGGPAPVVIATFANNTAKPGIDSLSRDPQTGDLLVADSPNGTIYRMSIDGANRKLIGHGFVRPTHALAGPDGSIYVADEYGNAVQRIATDGTVTQLAHLSDPDDLAWDVDGTLLVTVLGYNTVVRLDPHSGQQLGVVASDLFEPQGLAVDARGNIYVSEQRTNIIIELKRG